MSSIRYRCPNCQHENFTAVKTDGENTIDGITAVPVRLASYVWRLRTSCSECDAPLKFTTQKKVINFDVEIDGENC